MAWNDNTIGKPLTGIHLFQFIVNAFVCTCYMYITMLGTFNHSCNHIQTIVRCMMCILTYCNPFWHNVKYHKPLVVSLRNLKYRELSNFSKTISGEHDILHQICIQMFTIEFLSCISWRSFWAYLWKKPNLLSFQVNKKTLHKIMLVSITVV